MKNHHEFKKFIENFAEKSHKTFNCEDVYEAMPKEFFDEKEKHRILDDIEEMLLECKNLIMAGEDSDRIIFLNKAAFADGASFCVSPSEWETERGLLIIGDRFKPFDKELGLKNIEIVIPEKDRETVISPKEEKVKTGDARPFFYLSEIKKNAGAATKGKISVQCLHLKEFYRRHSFIKGDALRFTIRDCKKGILEMEYLPGTEKQAHMFEIRKWISCLEDALLQVCEESGIYLSASEQLLEAFAKNRKLLLEPLVSIEEFLRISQKIHVAAKEDHRFFWPKTPENDISLISDIAEHIPLSISMSDTSSLDIMLEDLDSVYGETSIMALMLDELNSGRNSLESVMMKIFDGADPKFEDEGQRAIFLNEIEELWEEVSENYNPANDRSMAPLRRALLDLLDRAFAIFQVEFSRSDGMDETLSSTLEFVMATQNIIEYALEKLNRYNPIDKKETKAIESVIKEVERQIMRREKELDA